MVNRFVFGSSRSAPAVIGDSYEWLERHFPDLPKPMVAAAVSINDDMGSPFEAAKILRDLRASPHILTRIFRLPHSALARQTCSLINLEDEPFHMVINGDVPLNYAIIVGRLASHDSKLQSHLFALLAKKKPKDEKAKSIVDEAMEDWAETESREQKRQHAERTFANPYWQAGAVLSWIAYRDRKLICQFENCRHWETAKWYNHGDLAWKVDHPDTELIRALQEGGLRSSRQMGVDLPMDLPPKFWARMTIRRVFAIDPIFERAEVFELWKTDPVECAQAVGSAATATKTQTEVRVARRRGPRAELRRRIVAQMKCDIESRKYSTDGLRKMTQEALAATYGAKSRETAVVALNQVLSEIAEKSITDK